MKSRKLFILFTADYRCAGGTGGHVVERCFTAARYDLLLCFMALGRPVANPAALIVPQIF